MQIPGTDAIRTQLQPSKPKRETTNITNSQNTKRTYGVSVCLFCPENFNCNEQITRGYFVFTSVGMLIRIKWSQRA